MNYPIHKMPRKARIRAVDIQRARRRAHEKLGLVLHLRYRYITGVDVGGKDSSFTLLMKVFDGKVRALTGIDESFFKKAKQRMADHAADAIQYTFFNHPPQRGPFE